MTFGRDFFTILRIILAVLQALMNFEDEDDKNDGQSTPGPHD